MIVEHFIDPLFLIEVAKSRRDYRYFVREFDKPSPRVVGEFPKLKKLRKLALEGQRQEASAQEKLRLEELLRMISDSGRVKRNTEFNGNISYQLNLQQVEKLDFRGVHFLYEYQEDVVLNSKKLSYNDFSDGVDALSSQKLASRTAEGISEALGELLRLSQEITLVDPYFSNQPGMWNTFLKCLEHAVTGSPVSQKNFNILYDSSKNKSGRSCQYLVEKLKGEALVFLHHYAAITFKDIREVGKEAIHNRYVITELSAVSAGYGFHETNEKESDEIMLLSRNIYEVRYGQYVDLQDFRVEEQATLDI